MSALITMHNDAIVSVRQDGSDYAEMQSLNEAIKILKIKRVEIAHESLPVWSKINNAHNYLCKQLTAMMSE